MNSQDYLRERLKQLEDSLQRLDAERTEICAQIESARRKLLQVEDVR